MKTDTVKLIIALALALALGFICEIIAPKTGGRNWISLAVGTVSIFAALLPAMGLQFENAKRGVSIKVFAWIMALALIIANIAFSCFEYKIDIYIAVCLLLSIVCWAVVYSLFRAKTVS